MKLQAYVDAGRRFPWRKQGRLFEPGGAWTHGSHPCAVHHEADTFVVAFTRRDAQRRSHVFLQYADVADGRMTLRGEPKLALSPGEPGCFDCDGAISVC